MNIGTATAPLANGVDDVNHADASGTAAVNKDSCLVTVQTPTNDVEVLACARDDVVGETESARATPPRVAHRCNAAPSYSPSYLCQCASTRSFCAESEHFSTTSSVAPNDKSTLTLDDVRTTK
jgi:hypothetical protein